MNQRATQSQLLFHASRKFPCPAVLKWFYLYVNVLDQVVVFFYAGAKDRREEVEVLLDGQVLVKTEFPGHVADAASDACVVFYDVEAIDGCCALVRQQECRQDAEDAGLAGAVGADEAKQLTRLDLQAYLFHGQHLSFVVRL